MEKQGDLDVVDGEDACIGPWAAWDGEHQAGFLDGVEELPEGQTQEEEEEEPEPSMSRKKAKPKRGAVGQEISVFHGNTMTDYQGRTYMHPPPHGGASSCKRGWLRGDLYYKGLRSYIDGPYPRHVCHMTLPRHRPPPAQWIYGH